MIGINEAWTYGRGVTSAVNEFVIPPKALVRIYIESVGVLLVSGFWSVRAH
jgi:hypothetical protein